MQELEQEVIWASDKIKLLTKEIHKKIIGQDKLIRNLIIWLLAKWHILLEWVPWLAKTLTVDTLSKTLDLNFSRVQFTPDLLPSDLVWTEIFNSKTWEFSTKKWPIFANFVLADEINRAPSKVQSALLEAMAEKQITIWKETFKLDEPFLVLATQNPIEQSWVYKLPEAQLDRFLLKTNVYYPSREEEFEMYSKLHFIETEKIEKILNKKEVLELQDLVENIFVSENILKYIVSLVDSTRNPQNYWIPEIAKYLNYGVSPRAWISLIKSAKVLALMNGRTFVIPEDIKEIANEVISHRMILNYEAIVNNISSSQIVEKVLENVKVS